MASDERRAIEDRLAKALERAQAAVAAAESAQVLAATELRDVAAAEGAHVHDVEGDVAQLGGLHQHVFRLRDAVAVETDGGSAGRLELPAGTLLVTNADAAHAHSVDSRRARREGSDHRHVITLAEGVEFITETNGVHEHAVEGRRTREDGAHRHTLAVGDVRIDSLAGEELRGLAGALTRLREAEAQRGLAKAARPALKQDELPTDGLVVSPQFFADAIMAGTKTLLVKSRPFDIGGARYLLINERKALGVVELGAMEVLSEEDFAAREDEHLISDTELARWCAAQPSWCEGPYYAWKVTVVESFDEPLRTNVPTGPQVVVHDVRVAKAAFLDPSVCSVAHGGVIEEVSAAVLTSGGLVPVVVWQAEPPRGELPALKVPDPEFLVSRLREGQTAGLLSRLQRTARVGMPQALVNEIGPGGRAEALVWAVVAQDEPLPVESMAQLTAAQRAGVDEFSAREFATERGIWYLPLKLVVVFDPPLRLRRPPPGRRFGSTVDFDRDVVKGRLIDVQRQDPAADAMRVAADPSPEALARATNDYLTALDRELHRLFASAFAGSPSTRAVGLTREDVVNAHAMVLAELERRRVQTVETDALAAETDALLRGLTAKALPEGGGKFAPIHPGGARAHADDPVALDEVLGALSKPMALRMPAVYLVGSVCNAGKSENDIDLLIRGPFDEETEHVIKFRLGRALGPRLSQRVQFHTEAQGGPFTNHVALYDLVLVPHEDRAVKEMALAKQDDPMLDWPDAPGKRRAVLQFHFRGRTLHADLRMKVADHLVGWTLALQKPGAVPEVDTVTEARRIADQFDVAGSRYTKPMLLPKRIYAAAKSRQPVAWLDLGDVKIEPGGVGATRNEPGVYVEVATPKVEWGMQKPYSHEYFLTGDPKFAGTLSFRMIEGDAGRESGADASDTGGLFWTTGFNKSLVPGVLRQNAVDNRTMPPLGQSAMPATLMRETPPEFRFWLADSEAEARRIRDDLVAARVFTDETVALDAAGEYRLSARKALVRGYEPEDDELPEVAKLQRVRFALLWQWWKGQTVVRAAPSRQLWHLVIEDPAGGVVDYQLQRDPLSGEESIAAVRREAGRELLDFEGDAPPGTKVGGLSLNETKATPSSVQRVDSGQVDLLDAQRSFLKLRARGRKLKGLYTLVAEEAGSDLFLFGPGVEPPRRVPEDAEKQGHAHRLPDGGVTGAARAGDAHWHPLPDGGRTGGPVLRGNVHVHELPGGRLTSPPVDAMAKRFRVADDGTQVWSPADMDAADDKGSDRELLRPPALFQPMKPAKRESTTFGDLDAAARGAFTDELVASGVQVEPKYNGFRAVAERWDADVAPSVPQAGILVFTEDQHRDISAVLPGLAKELRAIGGNFILDGEIMAVDAEGNYLPRRELAAFRGNSAVDDANLRFVVFDAVYLGRHENVTAATLAERRRTLERWWAERKLGESSRFVLAPRRLARTRSQLRTALEWAQKQPGSEGGMLKHLSSTYSLGGENDLWAKVKTVRELRAIVTARHPVKGSPGTFNFVCAVGPIPAGAAAEWAEPVEHAGKTYVAIGRTGNRKLDAKVGDTLTVEVLELLWEDEPPRRIRWFGPAQATGVVDGGPSTVEAVRRMLRPGELERGGVRASKLFKRERPVRLLKAEEASEERYVFGVVLVPDEPDAQGDIYSSKEVEKAAHSFLEHFGGKMKLMHRGQPVDGVVPIESYLSKVAEAHGGETFPVGTWFLATRVANDEVWEAVKAGAFTGYSMGGTALREALGPELA